MSSNDSSVCKHLLELVDMQGTMIEKQNELIAKLANENFEQENLISVLIKESSE